MAADSWFVVAELRRVLKPGGRLVVGEFMDPHYVPLVTLLRHAHASRPQLTVRPGPALGGPARGSALV